MGKTELVKSKLQPYSLGIVAEDKIKDDWNIKVTPIELYTTATGDVSETIEVSGEVKDANGNRTSLAIEKEKWITAEWLPSGNNSRITPPDVTKGMTVMIYNYAGEETRYWTTIFNELDLTKREKVVWAYSNKETIPSQVEREDSEFLLTNSYNLTIDTYDKYIKLHTGKNESSANPEAVTYDLEIDTANGVITVKDEKENSIELKSQDGIMTIKLNKDYNLTVKENINLIAEEQMYNLTTKKEAINITAEEKTYNLITKKDDINVTAEETNINVTAKKTYNLKADDGITMKTNKNMEVELDKVKFKNNTAELIDLLCQLIQANIAEQHLGNMGAPTALMATSVQKYQEILQKLQTFKC